MNIYVSVGNNRSTLSVNVAVIGFDIQLPFENKQHFISGVDEDAKMLGGYLYIQLNAILIFFPPCMCVN